MQEEMNLGVQIARVAGSLALVLVILLGGIYALKRWGQWVKRTGPASLIQVLGQHSLGPKHFLLVVKIYEESFLIGVSPQGMNLISALGPRQTETGEQRAVNDKT